MPAGRPEKYTKELGDELAEGLPKLFENGESVVEVCAELKMSKESYYKLCEISKKFSDADRLGRQLSEAWWTKLGRAGASGQIQANSAMWKFNMVNRMGWKEKLEHSGDGDNPISLGLKIEFVDNNESADS